MGALTFAGRVVLVVLNIIFILVALAFVVGGFILRFGTDLLHPLVKKVLDSVNSATDAIFGVTIDTDSFDLGSIATDLAIAMIIVGLVLLAFSFVGCCGACCNFSTVMLVYAIILAVLLLVQVALVIVVFGAPQEIKKYMNPALKKTLVDYQGLKGSTIVSLGWNWAMQEFDCCGVESYEDFINKGEWKGTNGDGANVVTPIACCKTLPSNQAGIDACAGSNSNDINAIASLSNANQGCVDAIWSRIIEGHKDAYLPAVVICLVAQAVLILFAILVYKDRGITGGLV